MNREGFEQLSDRFWQLGRVALFFGLICGMLQSAKERKRYDERSNPG